MSISPAERSLPRSVVIQEAFREPKLKNGRLTRTLLTLTALKNDIEEDNYERRTLRGAWHEQDFVIDPHVKKTSVQLLDLIQEHGTLALEDSQADTPEKDNLELVRAVNPVTIRLEDGTTTELSTKQYIRKDKVEISLTDKRGRTHVAYTFAGLSGQTILLDRKDHQVSIQEADFVTNVITLIRDRIPKEVQVFSYTPR